MRVGLYGREDRPELHPVAAGIEALGWECVWRRPGVFTADQVEDFDAVVTFGLRLHSGAVRDAYWARGVPVLTHDLPPLRLEGYWALWPGEINRLPENAPRDRLDRVPFEIQPLRGSAILVCGQKGGDAAHALDSRAMREWAGKTCRLLQQKFGPDRRIVWRPHPQEPFEVPGVEHSDSQAEALEDVLPEVSALVTHNSTCGIAALLRGIPVYCAESAFYRQVASGTGFPPLGGDRYPSAADVRDFFARLMYVQWTDDEIASGEPLRLTLERAEVHLGAHG